MFTFADNVGFLYAESEDISLLEDIKTTLKDGIEKENQKSVKTFLPSWGEGKAGKKRKYLFAV